MPLVRELEEILEKDRTGFYEELFLSPLAFLEGSVADV